jgi:hypothetical protein
VIALTGDFHIFASRVTTALAAVLSSNWYIAQARYVRALFRLLIRHDDSFLPTSVTPRSLT